MQWRRFVTILLAGALALLTLAGGGVAWVLAQSPLNLKDGGVNATPTAAMFVPKQAPLMVSLLVNPDRLESLLTWATPLGDRPATQRELRELKAGLLSPMDLAYPSEIQPWLGEEITLAITSLDYDRNPENGSQLGYLLAAEAKSATAARRFLQLLYAKGAIAGEADLVFEQYKGVNVIYRQGRQGGASLASAVVGDRYVLISNHPKVLRDAINNVQVPSLNLAASETYQQALAPITRPRIGVAYVNLLALANGFETEPTAPAPAITLALTLSPQGLIADTAVTGLANAVNAQGQLTAPVPALQYLPPKTSLVVAGEDLEQFWTQITTSLGSDSPVTQFLQTVLGQFSPDLDLPAQIFPWVTADYAFSLLPNRDWVFVTRHSPATDTALDELNRLAQAQDLNTTTFTIQEQPVTAWAALAAAGGQISAQVQGAHTQIGDYTVISNSLNVISNLLRSPTANLTQSQEWREAIAPLPTPNAGYVYLNWPQVRPLITQKFPVLKVLEVAGKPILERVRSFSLTTTESREGITRATVAFNLSLF